MVACRSCKNTNLHKFLSLGNSPLANSFLAKEQLDSAEPFYPLDVYFCDGCGLAQLGYVVPAEEMFANYLYVPSTSETFVKHFSQMAEETIQHFGLTSNDLVVDIGGNDGTLLRNFQDKGIKVLNVEPAKNIAVISEKAGIETINKYFTVKVADEIVGEKGTAKVVIGTNVFTHIDNLDDFLRGVSILLDEKGIFIIEVYYFGDIIRNSSFDIIYHEHLSYFTVYSLKNLFERFGLRLFDVKRVPIHGGSLRAFISKPQAHDVASSVDEMISTEAKLGLNSLDTYNKFAEKIESVKQKLLSILAKLKSEGKIIVGYGAPAKSTTLLNYFGIGRELIEYIVDKSTLKQNLYTPGMHIPILSPERLLEDKPDYVLILAWNFADEIMKQQSKYKELGGKFIVPIPSPVII